MPPSLVIIVCAFSHESKAIRTEFCLHRNHNDKLFPVYTNSNNTLYLIESGQSTIASAVAATYAFSITGSHEHTFLCNIGIAGGDYPLGSVFQINKITEQHQQQNHYPKFYSHLPSTRLQTVTLPSNDYKPDHVIDMEGSGFYQACSKLINHEQISLLKVVSDNPLSPHHLITPKHCHRLMQDSLHSIQKHISLLIEHSTKEYQLNNSAHVDTLLQRYHFSQYQRTQLIKLCRRWQALNPKHPPTEYLAPQMTPKIVIDTLEKKLNSLPVNWNTECK